MPCRFLPLLLLLPLSLVADEPSRGIVFCSYNLENFSEGKEAGEGSPRGTKPKSEAAIATQIRILSEISPDVLGVCEMGSPAMFERFQAALKRLAEESTGSSTFVARAIVLVEPPSVEAREITDKGSLNQKAVLAHRAALVDELYAASPPARVILAKSTESVPT